MWLDLPHIGAFEGASYCDYGIWRPTENSMMRQTGEPFYEVNSEAMIWNIYKNLNPFTRFDLLSAQN